MRATMLDRRGRLVPPFALTEGVPVIKLLRVPLENKPGQLYGVVTIISAAGVDMKALSLTNQGPDSGEVLLLVTDLAKARKALEKAGLGCSAEPAVVPKCS